MVIKRISARNYQLVMDPSTARYIMDYLYFARDVEPVWYYKKVSSPTYEGNYVNLILSASASEYHRIFAKLSRCFCVRYYHHNMLLSFEHKTIFSIQIVTYIIEDAVCDLERKYTIHLPYVCFESVVMNFGLTC